MLSGLHTTYSQGFYRAERDYGLKVSENLPLLQGNLSGLVPHLDRKDSIAIGYGYDLLDLGKTMQQIRNDLSAVGVVLTLHDDQWLTDYRNGLISRNFLIQNVNGFTTTLGVEPVAAALLTDVLDDKYEPILTARLAQFGIALPDSRERAALMSLAYANPTKLLGDKLMGAGEEKGTGYFSEGFRGRPRGRSVDSKPKVVAITACQSVVPKGCWRFTQVRSVVSS